MLPSRYDIVHRTSLDLQAARDATLWKLEALHESGQRNSYPAWGGGFEYTWFGISRVRKLGRKNDIAVSFDRTRGKGSHGTPSATATALPS